MNFMHNFRPLLRLFVIISLTISSLSPAVAASESYGYQLALLDVRASNPQDILLNKKISPSSAAVREFEWILETFRNRCHNSPNAIVTSLVGSWRVVQKRGYRVSLLVLARELSDFSNLAFHARRNQKMDFDKLILKLLKDKYPQQ